MVAAAREAWTVDDARVVWGTVDAVRRSGAYVEGEGEHAPFFAQPVKLGKEGAEAILSYGELSDFERNALDSMLETLNGDIEIGVEFAK